MPKFVVIEHLMNGDGNIGHNYANARALVEAFDHSYDKYIVASMDFTAIGETGFTLIKAFHLPIDFYSHEDHFSSNIKTCLKNILSETVVMSCYYRLKNSIKQDSGELPHDNVFCQDLSKLFFDFKFSKEDIIFWGSLSINNLPDIVRVYEDFFDSENGPKIFFCIWESLWNSVVVQGYVGGSQKFAKRCLQCSNKLKSEGKFHFYSDSDARTAQYNNLMGKDYFKTIPMISKVHCLQSKDGERSNSFSIGFLGSLRECKGSYYLPSIIERILKTFENKVVIHVQTSIAPYDSNYIRLAKIAKRIGDKRDNRIVVYSQGLSADEYSKVLQKCDLIILPYEKSFYNVYTSGPFAEAIQAGKPVIVPELTWMARRIENEQNLYFHDVWDSLLECRIINNKIKMPKGKEKGICVFKYKTNRENNNYLNAVFWIRNVKTQNKIRRVIQNYTNNACYVAIEFDKDAKEIEHKCNCELMGVKILYGEVSSHRIGMIYHERKEIPRCIEYIIDNYTWFKSTTMEYGDKWRQSNGPENVKRTLLEELA